MPDRAPYENLEGQLDMWSDFATPSCNSVRAKNPPPDPDENGLFDSAGVIEIAGRRQCAVTIHSDLLLTITAKVPISLVALQPGRWDPVAILSACTRAQGRQAFEVDLETAKPSNPVMLDEIRIARIVGADGLRPYLSRKGKYAFSWYEGGIMPPLKSTDVVLYDPNSPDRPRAGSPTWSFKLILIGPKGISKYEIRRALRALEDVGLLHITLGPRGGLATAKFRWTERAYLRPSLNLYEHDAICAIAEGLV